MDEKGFLKILLVLAWILITFNLLTYSRAAIVEKLITI